MNIKGAELNTLYGKSHQLFCNIIQDINIILDIIFDYFWTRIICIVIME